MAIQKERPSKLNLLTAKWVYPTEKDSKFDFTSKCAHNTSNKIQWFFSMDMGIGHSTRHPSESAKKSVSCFEDLQISVGTAGRQPRAPDLSGLCRSSTTHARCQWALPDLNHERQMSVGTAGPQSRAPGVR